MAAFATYMTRLRATMVFEDPPDDPMPAQPPRPAVAHLHALVTSERIGRLMELQPHEVATACDAALLVPGGLDAFVPAPSAYAGATPLWVAARVGCVALVELLVAKGADVNRRTHSAFAPLRREAPIHTAARFGHAAVLAFLVQLPQLHLHRFKDDGATAMFLAMQEGHTAAAQVLLAAGANPNLVRFDGTPPLLMAAQKNNLELLTWLVAAVSRREPPASLLVVAPDAHVETHRLSLEARWIHINATDARGVTPIMACCNATERPSFELLLSLPETDLSIASVFNVTVFEHCLSQCEPELAMLVCQQPRFVARPRSWQMLNRIVTEGESFNWKPGQIAIVDEMISLLLARQNPFELSPSLFERCGRNTPQWWHSINKHKEWSPRRHSNFPADFRASVVCFLLCMKRLAPTMSYRMPLGIQFQILLHLSRAEYLSTTPDAGGPPPPRRRYRLDYFSEDADDLKESTGSDDGLDSHDEDGDVNMDGDDAHHGEM